MVSFLKIFCILLEHFGPPEAIRGRSGRPGNRRARKIEKKYGERAFKRYWKKKTKFSYDSPLLQATRSLIQSLFEHRFWAAVDEPADW